MTLELNVPENGHAIILAQEVCPHLWDMLEDAAESGRIDLTLSGEIIANCKQCKSDLLMLVERYTDKMDGTMGFSVRQIVKTLRRSAG